MFVASKTRSQVLLCKDQENCLLLKTALGLFSWTSNTWKSLIDSSNCCSWIRLSVRKMSDHGDVYLVPNDDQLNDDRPKRSINSLPISPHSKWSQSYLCIVGSTYAPTCGCKHIYVCSELHLDLFLVVLWFNWLISIFLQMKSTVKWYFF